MTDKELTIKKIGSAIDALYDSKDKIVPIYQKKFEEALKTLDSIYYGLKALQQQFYCKEIL